MNLNRSFKTKAEEQRDEHGRCGGCWSRTETSLEDTQSRLITTTFPHLQQVLTKSLTFPHLQQWRPSKQVFSFHLFTRRRPSLSPFSPQPLIRSKYFFCRLTTFYWPHYHSILMLVSISVELFPKLHVDIPWLASTIEAHSKEKRREKNKDNLFELRNQSIHRVTNPIHMRRQHNARRRDMERANHHQAQI
jgi:hypothetical protein